MNYLIFDLEFNQKYSASTEDEANTYSSLPFEIIQIGAIKLNNNFETVAKFNSLVKPTVYPTIHPYIENLTKINSAAIISCRSFPEVYKDFLEFMGSEEIILCVWGLSDIKELLRNIKFYNLSSSSISKNYIDIQSYASKTLKAPKGSKIGLETALNFLHIPIDKSFHDALNDAYYTAEVFKSIYDDTMKASTYVPTSPRRVKVPNEKIDTIALINQFEKMYNRDMSPEEKSIIKLAYIMGRTKQFII